MALRTAMLCVGGVVASGGLSACGREAPPAAMSLHAPSGSARVLAAVAAVPAERHGRSFEVKARSPHVSQFPCSTCHLEPLPEAASAEAVTLTMHADVSLAHAGADTMTCFSCHDRTSLDHLVLPTGRRIAFDHAYRLCGTCHFEQERDWAGGAHGKRVGGWSGRRVVQNCTECHDPHRPGFEPRWPAMTPHIPRKAGVH
jgi:hypothetical protein